VSIKVKLILPVVLCALVLGLAAFMVMEGELSKVKGYFVTRLAEGRSSEMTLGLDTLSKQLVEKASLFSRLPVVLDNLKAAYQGNIDNEADPAGQAARENLRVAIKDYQAGYMQATGQKVRLQVSLKNSHSLVRLWQDKQVERDGKWLDVSDDLSSFRPSLAEVRNTEKPLTGIEVGRSGLDVRGIVPIKDEAGKYLGAVEIQADFNELLANKADKEGARAILFMNSELLSVSTGMRDKDKFPLLGDKFVFVAGDRASKLYSLADADFVSEGRKGIATKLLGDTALAAIPLKDYRGSQIGVMVYAFDVSAANAILSGMANVLGLMLVGLVVVVSGVLVFFSVTFVTRPVDRVVTLIKDIVDDKADLDHKLAESSGDEIGRLCRNFNKLMGKINDMLCRVEGYRNVVDAIHNPVFAVDDNYNMILANKTVAEMFGVKSADELVGKQCSKLFNTDFCGTENCPIHNSMKTQSYFEAKVTEMHIKGKKKIVKPFSDIVKDCHGKVVGYLEVVNDVTELVEKEQQIQGSLEKTIQVNEQIADVSSHVAQASQQMSSQVDEVMNGTQRQRDLVAGAATAMEEMNTTILEVARNASAASKQASQGKLKAQDGARVVEKAVSAISKVNELSIELRENLTQLGNQANDIGKIMNVISEIADQTNLLALNAAIEAARAGDAGRGFAVVADEVRKLAEKTLNATAEVRSAIEAIQSGSLRNLKSMETVSQAVGEATDLAAQSGQALNEIVGLVQDTSDQVLSIATAAEEQSSTSEEINRTIAEVNDISGSTADGMAKSSKAVGELSSLAKQLEAISSS
jgi:PAS domain S-box-containing protein